MRPSRARSPLAALAPLLLALLATRSAHADEGQWMPTQIKDLDEAELKRLGLAIPRDQLWSDTGGLLRAAVNLSGCSAAFVSKDGLIATNHHCAHPSIQANSDVKHDYLKDGFLAKDRKQELPGKDLTVRVLEKIEDVTPDIKAAADGAKDDRARAKAIDKAKKTLVDTCEKAVKHQRCEVTAFYGGTSYHRFTYRELRDVRVVYAPPVSVGDYGGEEDNWMWPRHTGDFTLLRAYGTADNQPAEPAPDNVPYHPLVSLPVSSEGVGPGSFVGVLGYPGRTQRYLPAKEVSRLLEQVYPARIDLYGEWIAIFDKRGEENAAVKIKGAASRKSLANGFKNGQGMIAGLNAMKLVERREREEAELVAWAAKPENAASADVVPKTRALSDARRETFAGDYLLTVLSRAGSLLPSAVDIVRRAHEAQKPDLERVTGYLDRDKKSLEKKTERRVRDYDAETDAQLIAALLARAAKLGPKERIAGFEPLLAGAKGTDRAAFVPAARKLLAGSKLGEKDVALKLLGEDEASLGKQKDELLALARALLPAIEAMEAREETDAGQQALVGPRYFAMLRTIRKGPVYPDANSTLRFSYATVSGYSPKDGLIAAPQTTLAGLLAKDTGKSPFEVPQKIKDAAPGAKNTVWADPALGDLPIDFLSNADTTGGNSGSPVINGKGELVGLNFDRVWENVAGDFGYNPARSRNVVVDVRYLLWLLDKTEDAGALLDELGMGQVRKQGPRPSGAKPAASSPASSAVPGTKTASGSCGCSRGEAGAFGGLFLLRGLWRRRKEKVS